MDDRRDHFGTAHASHRCLAAHVLDGFRLESREQWRLDDAGCDRVHRIPSVITSLARAFVRQTTPALETEYGIMFGLPSLPEMEAAT